MANSKKASTRKIIDVSDPDSQASETSSKSIIVTNRPIMKDPMMVAEENNANNKVATSAFSDDNKVQERSSTKSKIEPLSAPIIEGETIIEPQNEDTSKEEVIDESATKKPLIINENNTKAPITEISPIEAKNEPAIEPTPVKEETEPVASTDNKPAETKPVENLPSEPETPENNEVNKTDNTDKNVEDKNAKQIEAEEASKIEAHEQAINKLVESKQYFLPINSVEKRRSKRFVSLGILLSLLLIIAWADIALDAGIINLSGSIPHTHFFSSNKMATVASIPITSTKIKPLPPKTTTASANQAKVQLASIKNLLEIFYNSNGFYPGDMSPNPLINQPTAPVTSTLEFVPPSGVKFVYSVFPSTCTTTQKNCLHYNLKAIDSSSNLIESLRSVH